MTRDSTNLLIFTLSLVETARGLGAVTRHALHTTKADSTLELTIRHPNGHKTESYMLTTDTFGDPQFARLSGERIGRELARKVLSS